MNKPLSDALILVADDQSDVARTLCRPLQRAGARLRYVANGRTALAELATRPVDLVLVDMKMPPDEWGGLWLLRELQNGGWGVPTLALSGEGSKQQVIHALRLGAKNWVEKESAGEELLDQCVRVLAEDLSKALELSGVVMPTPLAYRFARFSRVTDSDKRMVEGLHVLESVLRFAAVLGLSSTPPVPLRGITHARMATPSMGTWFDLCTALADAPGAGDDFKRILSCLVPDRADRQTVQDFVSTRNDIAHGRAEPDRMQGQRLDALLRRFAHRVTSTWRADIGIPTSMTYDGSSYCIDVLKLRGSGKPSPDSISSRTPVVTGGLFLLPEGAEPLPLAPWLIVEGAEDPEHLHCLQFDGLQRDKRGPGPETRLKYAKADDGHDLGQAAIKSGGTWQSLAPWTDT
ncbi:response regulator [Actinacidiphila oryziradicis]|uniref:Response regulator n=1 Tax=Actinacidiphila oryziradicis TaxID=2571141 RepID=A0A4U0RNK8_9ACTN|nr:response regulator [Actinacidiphila oryziradicis]TJZ97471.1 response regulator [Actinacidiphila oryziradicis]